VGDVHMSNFHVSLFFSCSILFDHLQDEMLICDWFFDISGFQNLYFPNARFVNAKSSCWSKTSKTS
jgi:hypothetical protein